jgi:hypothetical protein
VARPFRKWNRKKVAGWIPGKDEKSGDVAVMGSKLVIVVDQSAGEAGK